MSLLTELKRRNVVRVGAAYVAVSWLLIQVAETTFAAFGLGDYAVRVVIIVLGIGLIPTLAFAWAFELTPEGFKRDSEVDRSAPVNRRIAKRLDRVIMLVLALALGYFAFDRFVLAPEREATVVEAAREAGRTEAIVDAYGDKSIAVMPFADLSPGGDEAYFADGIAEELLNILAKYNGLRVVSRSSSFALRDADLSVPDLGRKLRVAHVLEGSVRKAGERVRITAQLIEASTDTHLWSQTYDRELDDVFATQDQIAAEVARELKVRLLAPPRRAHAMDPATYDLYLQGLGLFARRGTGNLTQAMTLFEQVTMLSPTFAPGFASLALTHFFRGPPEPGIFTRIETLAQQALALDPENSDALALMGRVRSIQGDAEQGRALLERSLTSNPNNSLGHRWLGLSYRHSNPARYVALAQRAQQVDPLDPSIHVHVTISLSLLGHAAEALAAAKSRLAYDPGDPDAIALAANAHFLAGHLDRSLKSYYLEYRARPGDVRYSAIQHVLINLNELDLAEAWTQELERRTGTTDHYIAIVTALRGEPETALQQTMDNVARGESSLFTLAFETLRFTHDLRRTRTLYDQAFAELGKDPKQFDPELLWVWYIDYALILQRTGDVESAGRLIRDLETHFDAQARDGIVVSGNEDHLQRLYAEVHAIRGDAGATVAALQQAVRDGDTCAVCIRTFPHFDSVRDDPGFVAVLAELEAKNAAQRERLAQEGMLLTPQQVMALEDFEFDPFVE